MNKPVLFILEKERRGQQIRQVKIEIRIHVAGRIKANMEKRARLEVCDPQQNLLEQRKEKVWWCGGDMTENVPCALDVKGQKFEKAFPLSKLDGKDVQNIMNQLLGTAVNQVLCSGRHISASKRPTTDWG